MAKSSYLVLEDAINNAVTDADEEAAIRNMITMHGDEIHFFDDAEDAVDFAEVLSS